MKLPHEVQKRFDQLGDKKIAWGKNQRDDASENNLVLEGK